MLAKATKTLRLHERFFVHRATWQGLVFGNPGAGAVRQHHPYIMGCVRLGWLLEISDQVTLR